MSDRTRQGRPPGRYGHTGHTVARNTRRLRQLDGTTIDQLADTLQAIGHPLSPIAIGRIERHQRQVTVDDLASLATALGVTPTELLEPPADCDACHGAPPPGFICQHCGTASEEPPA